MRVRERRICDSCATYANGSSSVLKNDVNRKELFGFIMSRSVSSSASCSARYHMRKKQDPPNVLKFSRNSKHIGSKVQTNQLKSVHSNDLNGHPVLTESSRCFERRHHGEELPSFGPQRIVISPLLPTVVASNKHVSLQLNMLILAISIVQDLWRARWKRFRPVRTFDSRPRMTTASGTSSSSEQSKHSRTCWS